MMNNVTKSRKMNSLAFILECLFCIDYNFIKTSKRRSRGCIPQKNFCCIPPNSSHRYGVLTLVLQLATLLNDAFYPRKNIQKAKDSRPRWGVHSATPDPLAGFKAVLP